MAEILVTLTLIGLVVTSIVLWLRVAKAQKAQQPHMLSARDCPIAPLGLLDVFVVLMIQLLFQSIGLIPVYFLTNTQNIDMENVQQMTLINFFLGAASIAAAVASMAWLGGRYQDRRAAGWNPKSFAADVKLGCYGFLLFVPPVLLLQSALTQLWEYEHATMNLISPDSSLLTILSAWLMATIVAPFNEEVLFRVVLLGWLLRCFANPRDLLGGLIGGHSKKKTSTIQTDETPDRASSIDAISEIYDPSKSEPADSTQQEFATTEEGEVAGTSMPPNDTPVSPWQSPTNASRATSANLEHEKPWAPLFIVALLFALAHVGQGPAPIPIFFLGFGLCFLYRQTGSLVPCVVTHYLLNTFSMAVFTLEQFYFPSEEAVPAPASIINTLTFFFQP